jgi:flagellar biogenesis protein FliO
MSIGDVTTNDSYSLVALILIFAWLVMRYTIGLDH